MARVTAAAPALHGGAPAGWLDFSANLNPLGVPSAVGAAIATAGYERYADLDAAAAERHLAAEAGVRAESVMLTAGATEALRLIAGACLGPGDRALLVGPTYGEYARLAALHGADLSELRASAPSFRPPVEALAQELRDSRPGVAFLCDPNNPTGQAVSRRAYDHLLNALASPSTRSSLVVIDQSFAPFAAVRFPDADLLATDRVLLVRSLTKLLAVPGIRVGYVIGHPRLLARLRAFRDPWPVGAHAIAAAAVASWSLSPARRRRIAAWRRSLTDGLRARGLRPYRSVTNFLLVEVGAAAPAVVERAARRRIGVRSCASFGLPEFVRLAVRPPHEQARLLAALDEILPGVRP
jgi:histidinol-phosphate/aromatic aminotransferase/cobyric acid decarboxylase-like protein